MSVEEVLRRYWGFEELRPLQQDVIEAALEGRDAVVVMPTGGGKSLCFQVPPLIDDGFTVVISPLISLMKDQVDGLAMVGYPAGALNSSMTAEEATSVAQGVIDGKLKLLYVSPERILTGSTIELLRGANKGRGVARIAIDEAHCISQWGHDFRPEYRQLARLRTLFPSAPIHALTATATPRVREDVARQLGLKRARLFVGCFDRSNLTYRVVPKIDPIRQVAELVQRFPGEASIVYCISRKDTEKMAAALQALGIPASAYHAGLEPNQRRQISEKFAQESLDVIVATVAFGMGIDRANVRCVIHESLPKSIEAYQQETGRAGRDGMPSECLMLYGPNDFLRWERLIRESASQDQADLQMAMVDEVRRYAVGTRCRHAFLSGYFGQEYEPDNCEACDLCIEGWTPVANGTKIAHQVLATVRDLERNHPNLGFGGRHVAQILGGSHAKKVVEFRHTELRGFGAMAAYSQDKVSAWIGQLVDLGLLDRIGGRFPTLKVSEEGRAKLLDRGEVILRDVAVAPARSVRRTVLPPTFDESLFNALRELRRRIAGERQVPAYVVFHDSALIALASMRPTAVAAFGRIPGIGPNRAAELGPRFLEVIKDHVAERGLSHDLEEGAIPAPAEPRINATSLRLRPHFESGQPIAQIAETVALAQSTVSQYLADWIVEAKPENIDPWVDGATYHRVDAALEEHGSLRLRPVFDALGEDIPYETIRLVAAHRSTR